MPCFRNSPHVSALIEFLGDGFCDDQNNFSNCEYDHDDCCRLNDPYAHNYCDICLCKSNETNYPISFETKPPSIQHDQSWTTVEVRRL